MLILVSQLKPLAKNKERSQKQPYLFQAGKYYIYFTLKLRLRINSNELTLIALFKRVEELPKDKKKIVKELIDAFLFKTEMQEKLK